MEQRLLIIGVAIATLGCVLAAPSTGKSNSSPTLVVARALLVTPGSRDSYEWAERELGCSPCEEVTVVEHDGMVLTYAVEGSGAVTIGVDEIERVRLQAVDGGYIVVVDLSPDIADRISSKAKSKLATSANFIDEEFVGVVPMLVSDTAYLVGRYRSQSEAEAVASSLGWSRAP